MRFFWFLFYFILIMLGVGFTVLNATTVKINFYFATWNIPIPILIISSLGAGIFLGCFLFFLKYWQLKVQYRKVHNRLKVAEKEIQNLRAIPLEDRR